MPNIKAIEIGCWEGRTTIWFLNNILNHESSRIVCIDPHPKSVFFQNIQPFRHKVTLMTQISQVALRDSSLNLNSFHFIYVDGNHAAPAVLEDAVLAFRLLRKGGIMIFDDYGWKSATPNVPQSMPKIAIDAFLNVFSNRLVLLAGRQLSAASAGVKEMQTRGHSSPDWQVAVKKLG